MKRLLALIALLAIAGCASFKTAWDNEHRAATLAQLKKDAISFLGVVAVNELHALAASNGDYKWSAADAVWHSVEPGNVAALIRHAGGTNDLAERSEEIATSLSEGQTAAAKRKVLDGVAAAIASATK